MTNDKRSPIYVVKLYASCYYLDIVCLFKPTITTFTWVMLLVTAVMKVTKSCIFTNFKNHRLEWPTLLNVQNNLDI